MYPASFFFLKIFANIYTEFYTDTLAIYCKISIFRIKAIE